MVTRITGMASGMDIDSIVKNMLKADSVKIDRVKQNKQKLQWKQQLYNDLNKDLANFLINTRKELGLMKTGSNGTNLNVGMSGIDWHKSVASDNEDIVNATVSGINSFSGTHTIKVESLAKGVSATKEKASIAVEDKNANDEGLGYTGSFEINGKKIDIISKDTLSTIAQKINSSGAGVKASYDSTLDAFFIQTDGVGTSSQISLTNDTTGIIDKLGLSYENQPVAHELKTAQIELDSVSTEAFSLTINKGLTDEKVISFEANTTIEQVVNSINSSGIEGMSAWYDSESKKLNVTGKSGWTIESTETGLNGLSTAVKKDAGYLGEKGKVHYNNIETEIESNDFSFNGINFTAKKADPAITVNVTVTTDVNSAVEKIKGFINEYNKIIEKVGNLIGEKTNRNYQPLTEEQKEAMTEKEIELWEDRAKKGLLYRDDTLGATISNIRYSLYEKVEGSLGMFDHLTEIGITTEKYTSGSVGGKLQIDEVGEEKLRNALRDDADGVLKLLFKTSETHPEDYNTINNNKDLDESQKLAAKNLKRAESGIFTRINDLLIEGMKGIIDRSGTGESSALFRTVKSNMLADFVTGTNNLSKKGSVSYIDDNLLKMDKEISNLNSWLFSRENAYYARFTAMEKAMQNMASQSGWLGQQMGM